ncbi:MAG: DNA polymerase Y family protein [Acidimicrobiia bacterium]
MRQVCVWCPDWPVIAWRATDPTLTDAPCVVLGRIQQREVVLATDVGARTAGVHRGARRREAEACCPGVQLRSVDPSRETRVFERVVRAIETFTTRIEVHHPGRVVFPTRGPSRYFGGDTALADQLVDAVRAAGVSQVRVGIADGELAAWCAARRADPVHVVPAGASAGFLAAHPIAVLGDADFADLAVRLGITTLGVFVDLPVAAVLARFGYEGVQRHVRARGEDATPLQLQTPPEELIERHVFDPPVARVDAAAFAAKSLADRCIARLERLGYACTRVLVEAETEQGGAFARAWRHDGPLDASALADRVRWQLEAWLQPDAATGALAPPGAVVDAVLVDVDAGPENGLVWVQITPEEIVPADGRQLGFWGGDHAAAERVGRACARVQSLCGPQSVARAVMAGGRFPHERVTWVPWGDVAPTSTAAPWPGGIPGPAPARVWDPPLPAELLDADGQPVQVGARGEVRTAPATLRCAMLPNGGGSVDGWAGPWAHDVRWWDVVQHRRGVCWQVRVRGVAALVVVQRGRAALVAVYD